MKNVRGRNLVIALSGSVILILLLVSRTINLSTSLTKLNIIDSSQFTPPSINPMPSYLVVYPKPKQTISLADQREYIIIKPDDPNDTAFNIPVHWEPGLVCVVLSAARLLSPGDFWEAEDIREMSSLIVNERNLQMSPEFVDGIVAHFLAEIEMEDDVIIERKIIAETGGPYGMCWEGPREPGLYIANFRFNQFSYNWWYKIEN